MRRSTRRAPERRPFDPPLFSFCVFFSVDSLSQKRRGREARADEEEEEEEEDGVTLSQQQQTDEIRLIQKERKKERKKEGEEKEKRKEKKQTLCIVGGGGRRSLLIKWCPGVVDVVVVMYHCDSLHREKERVVH